MNAAESPDKLMQSESKNPYGKYNILNVDESIRSEKSFDTASLKTLQNAGTAIMSPAAKQRKFRRGNRD